MLVVNCFGSACLSVANWATFTKTWPRTFVHTCLSTNLRIVRNALIGLQKKGNSCLHFELYIMLTYTKIYVLIWYLRRDAYGVVNLHNSKWFHESGMCCLRSFGVHNGSDFRVENRNAAKTFHMNHGIQAHSARIKLKKRSQYATR